MSRTELPPQREAALAAIVGRALLDSPFRKPSAWSIAVVRLAADEPASAKARCDFAGYLNANGLHASARECLARRVPTGSVLVWVEADTEECAAASFFVFDLMAAAKRAAANERTAPAEAPTQENER